MGAIAGIYYNSRQLASISDLGLPPAYAYSPIDIVGFDGGGAPAAVLSSLSYSKPHAISLCPDGTQQLYAVIEEGGGSANQYSATITASVSWT